MTNFSIIIRWQKEKTTNSQISITICSSPLPHYYYIIISVKTYLKIHDRSSQTRTLVKKIMPENFVKIFSIKKGFLYL